MARPSGELHPTLLFAGVSTGMERERLQNDSLVNGYTGLHGRRAPPTSKLCECTNSARMTC